MAHMIGEALLPRTLDDMIQVSDELRGAPTDVASALYDAIQVIREGVGGQGALDIGGVVAATRGEITIGDETEDVNSAWFLGATGATQRLMADPKAKREVVRFETQSTGEYLSLGSGGQYRAGTNGVDTRHVTRRAGFVRRVDELLLNDNPPIPAFFSGADFILRLAQAHGE